MSLDDRELHYLTEQLTKLEARMAEQIDPREYGRLEQEVRSLDSKLGDLDQKVERLTQKVETLVEIVTEAKGGWRSVVWLGSIAAALGSGATWVMTHLTFRP